MTAAMRVILESQRFDVIWKRLSRRGRRAFKTAGNLEALAAPAITVRLPRRVSRAYPSPAPHLFKPWAVVIALSRLSPHYCRDR